MIDYTNMDLYYEDSVNKQLKIEAEDGTIITNEDIFSESMTLEEGICSSESLTFGSCESSKFYVKIANQFSPLYGQWLTVSEHLYSQVTDEADLPDEEFVFGRYKVQSDKPTADRIYREITAYDAMYDIINADGVEVADWYNEVLPDNDSTITLYNFRKSFIAHFGLEEIETSLVNDDIVLEKTISTSSLSGQRVLEAICDINGVFAHITRDNKFEYIQLEPLDESKAFDIPLYKNCDYEDFETTVINCLQIREDDSDPGVVYGSGANRYIISGNFLLYGMTTEDLITVTANLYPVINKISYRPSTINAPGNPCLEVGDQIHLSSKYQEIYTYVLERNLSGIQALNDEYDSNGTETYIDSGGSIEEKIDQVKSRTAELADEVGQQEETIKVVVESIETDYAMILVLEAEVANIQTLFAEYATIQELEAALATIQELYVTYEEVGTLLADYASIEDLEALYANIETIVAGYITTDVIRAAIADFDFVTAEWVEANFANIEYLESNYASIIDLEAVYGDITLIDSDVANIINVLAGNVGTGSLEAVHLTADNAVIEEAVIVNALIDTVLADIIRSNIIYTDTITIMSENGGIIISGTTMQFSDSNGTVRLQLGEDADGNFTFVLYDDTGTGIMIDSEGIHESAVPDGLIVDSMVSDEANISGYKLNIAEVTQILNEQGLLQLEATQVTIDGETLDYKLTEITQTVTALESAGIASVTNYYALGGSDYPPCDPGEEIAESILGTMILGESLLGFTGWTTERLKAGYDEYLWYCQQIVYIDGTVAWTTPTLITDDYIRTVVYTQQTELEIVQGQIAAKVWESDIETATDSIWSQVNILTDNYGEIVVDINSIIAEVASLTTTVGDHYLEMTTEIANINVEIGSITSTVSSIQQSVDNIETYAVTNTTVEYYKSTSDEECIGGSWSTTAPEREDGYHIWMRTTVTYGFGTESRAVTTDPICIDGSVSVRSAELYYCVSESPDYYQPHGSDYPAIVGTAIVGESNIGETGVWTTEQPDLDEYEYVWMAYLVTYTNDTVAWTIPTRLTDPVVKEQITTLNEEYSQIEQTVGSITLTVASISSDLSGVHEQVSEIVMTIDSISLTVSTTSTEGSQYDFTDCQDFSGGTTPDGWTEYKNIYGTFEYVSDSTFGSSVCITKTREGSDASIFPCMRYNLGALVDGEHRIKLKARTSSGYESSAIVRISLYPSDESDIKNIDISNLSSTEWKEVDEVVNINWGGETYLEVGANALNAPIYVTDIQVLYPATVVNSGTLGSTASIVLSIDGKEQIYDLDFTNVRESFANDTSSIVISAGTILFLAGTLLMDSDNFILQEDGSIIAENGVFSGTLIARGDNYEMIMAESSLTVYYQDEVFGRIVPITSEGKPAYLSMLGNSDICGAISLGFDNTGYLFINNFQNPNGYSQRIQLAGSTIITGAITASSTLSVSGAITASSTITASGRITINTDDTYGIYFTCSGEDGTGTALRINQTWSNKSISLNIGTGGVNRGIYDNTDSAWIIYKDASYVRIPQATYISGTLTTTGRVSITTTNTSGLYYTQNNSSDDTKASIDIVQNWSGRHISLQCGSGGSNRGIYDDGESEWLIYKDSSSVVRTPGVLRARGAIYLNNNYGYRSYDSDGNSVTLLYISSYDEIYVGNNDYDTYYRGNRVYLGYNNTTNIHIGSSVYTDFVRIDSDDYILITGDGDYPVRFSNNGLTTTSPTNCTIIDGSTIYYYPPGSTTTGGGSLGTSSYYYRSIYVWYTYIGSDGRLKNAIDIDERYEKLFMLLNPVNYTWKNFSEEDHHDRVHCGFIAQEVEKACEEVGLSAMTYATVCHDELDEPVKLGDEEVTDRYALNYNEFHGLEVHMIQKAIKKEEELESRIEKLENGMSR